MGKVKAFVKDWKKERVKELSDLISKYKVVGLINLETLPSKQLQIIRANLRGTVEIIGVKKSLLLRAFEKANHNDMVEQIKGSPSILLTNLNPFKLYKLVKQNTSKSAIKGGQIAPYDLIVPKGETPFTPGPIIGELGQIGVKAKIDKGKIVVLKDSVVAKKDEPVDSLAAGILLRLGVQPIEISLDVVAIKEDNMIYGIDVLSVDYESMIGIAYTHAKNLVLNTGLFVSALIKEILQKAQLNALILNGVVHPEQAIKATPAAAEKEEEPEEKEEQVSEEEAAAGLGALFG